MNRTNYIKYILQFIPILISSCTLLPKSDVNKDKKFVVNSFWVQDTLSQPNNAFRKVNRMTPIIFKNSIILGNALDGLVAYDLTTKNELWRKIIPYGVEASAVAINDRLFVGSNNGIMYSVDLSSGQTIWEFDTKSELVAEPMLFEGNLYFVSGSQSLYSLDAVNGKQQWVYSRQDTTSLMTIRGGSKPSISNGIIYAGFSDGSVVALNASSGAIHWEVTLNRNTKFKDIDASPVIDGDYLYINSYDDYVYCLSKDKGEIVWKSEFGGYSNPLLIGEKLIATSSKGEITAISKKDGQLIWSQKTKNGIYVDPMIYKEMIVSGESLGKLIFFNQDGAMLGSFEPGRGVFSKPTVKNNLLYFISGEGNAYGIKAEYESKSSIYYLR